MRVTTTPQVSALPLRHISIWLSLLFFFSSRRRHTRFDCDWSSDVCSSDLSHVDSASSTRKRRFGGSQLGWIGLRSVPITLALGNWSAKSIAHIPFGIGKEIGRASCRERV